MHDDERGERNTDFGHTTILCTVFPFVLLYCRGAPFFKRRITLESYWFIKWVDSKGTTVEASDGSLPHRTSTANVLTRKLPTAVFPPGPQLQAPVFAPGPQLSKFMSDVCQKDCQKSMSDRMSKFMSDRMSEFTADRMSEFMSDRMSDFTSDRRLDFMSK